MKLKLITAIALFASTAAQADVLMSEQEMLATYGKSAHMIAPSVYSVVDGDTVKTFSFGDAGRSYMLNEMELKLSKYQTRSNQDPATLADLKKAIADLKPVANVAVAKNFDATQLCGATVKYTQTARRNIFEPLAITRAQLASNSGAPINARLSTYSSSIVQHGYFGLFEDFTTNSTVSGVTYAKTASASIMAAAENLAVDPVFCSMSQTALSLIPTAGCAESFRAVSVTAQISLVPAADCLF
jgi:hypothetical protein